LKALVASGGRGTRLRPITHTQNKHLIPIANKPILHYALEAIAGAGIKEVGIVYNGESQEVPQSIGDGSCWGLSITYIPQETPGGLAQVVGLGEKFVGGDEFIFYLGDNMVVGGIGRFVEQFHKSGCDCLLTLAHVKDPERFGVPEIHDGRIVRVVEKPVHPKSGYAVAGIYVYNSSIFEAVKSLKPSARGELEISDAHQYLIDHRFKVDHCEITGWWKDTGKPEDLLEANRLVLEHCAPMIEGEVDDDSQISGIVVVGKGTRVVRSRIEGPVILGNDCLIQDSYVGPYTSIGHKTAITSSKIEFSIVLERCRVTNVGTRLKGSILGYDVEIAEGVSNRGEHRFLIGDQSRVDVG
jgi:glucose-1-phosphate thymidylyltransferase